MEKTIDKTFSEKDVETMRRLLGKKIEAIHHDEFVLGNLSIQKVGIISEEGVYALETYYEYLDFLWGKEGVAGLHFTKTDDDGLIVKADPPTKYVTSSVNDKLEDIRIVRESVKEFYKEQSLGTFIYDKGIILVFKGHQIGLELDNWMSEMIRCFRSTNALTKFDSIKKEWNDSGLEDGAYFEVERSVLSLKNMKAAG